MVSLRGRFMSGNEMIKQAGQCKPNSLSWWLWRNYTKLDAYDIYGNDSSGFHGGSKRLGHGTGHGHGQVAFISHGGQVISDLLDM